ncbi:glycoside hydrolase family 2 protein [Bombilactobacillus bombi]|uniref:glycoside hydrolase family 2 protein n=1 Tax=Bombilactobacillus bombi TaxID=1303590 RepID=UPI0015E5CE65|nr:glycoside hydrolase family 2 TIM barrel-domain containing protein [Bombilactobacillus bombi]MBA1435199.1 glycoside hydrolase family 2 protein [Bombilactobacillus bombi]
MKQTNWNQDWFFWEDKNSFALLWNIPENAQKINLPHDAMLQRAANAQSPNGGNTGFRDGGTYVYVKNLTISSQEADKVFLLKFEGSYMNTFVYVNGQLAAKRPYGYSTFYVPLNDFLNYDTVNEIRVQIKAGAMPNSRWYSGAGLIRDVYFLEGSQIYLQPDYPQIQILQAQEELASINVTTIIKNKLLKSTSLLQLQTLIYDDQDQLIIDETAPLTITGINQRKLVQKLTWDNPQLWDEHSPHLYRCVLRLFNQDQELIDHTETIFGVRALTLDPKNGLRVNGQKIKLRGACIHHDSGLLGAATYDIAAYRQVKLLKQAGFNAVRMAHQPAAPALLRACDELGMYVMDETFDMWNRSKSDYDYSLYFQEWWPKDVQSMIFKDFNHPSVIMYSIGNEIPEIATNQGIDLSAKISQFIHQLDPSRYTLAAVNGLFSVGNDLVGIVNDVVKEQKGSQEDGNVNDFMTAMNQYLDQIIVNSKITKRLNQVFTTTDIAGYNYMTARYEDDIKKYSQRIIVGTETYPPQISRNWPLVQKHSQIIGDFTWTGWDYIGEAGVGIPGYQPGEGGFGAQYPAQLAYVGDIDIIGHRRPLSYYREIIFGLRNKPYIAVQNPHHYGKELLKTPWMLSDTVHSWSWDVPENSPIKVEVYSAGSEVELLLNDKIIAKKSVGPDHRTLFDLKYIPGKLTAISYKNGQEIGRQDLETANSNQLQIRLQKVDYSEEMKQKISYQHQIINGQLVFVAVELVDIDGNLITDNDQVLKIKLSSGKGAVIGFGSGNPKPLNNFNQLSTKTFNGHALAIIKRQSNQPLTITVTSPVNSQETMILD